MRFRRTECRRAVDAYLAPDYQSISVVDRLPYDPALGANQCYMPPVVAAAIAVGSAVGAAAASAGVALGAAAGAIGIGTGAAISGAAMLSGVTLVGAALSIAGAATGNETLSWIGMGVGLVGSAGGALAASAAKSAAASAAKAATANVAKTALGGLGNEASTYRGIAGAAKGALTRVPSAAEIGGPSISSLGWVGNAASQPLATGGVTAANTATAIPKVSLPSAQRPLVSTTTGGPGSPSILAADAFTTQPPTQTFASTFTGDTAARTAITDGLLNRTLSTAGGAGGGFFNSVGQWVEANPLATMIGVQTLAPMIPSKMNQSQRAYYDANAANSGQNTAEAAQRLRWAQGLM